MKAEVEDLNICVFGAASDMIEQVYKCAAWKLGNELADAGLTLVFGAGCTGLMGAVCNGVLERGGRAIGIAPLFFENSVLFDEQKIELIRTQSMHQRKYLMEEKSDAFIILPGGIGTFEEFFEVLTLKQLNRHKKPIYLLNTKSYYDPLMMSFNHMISESFAGSELLDNVKVFSATEELIKELTLELNRE